MTRAVLRWGGIGVGGLVGLLLLAVVVAAVTDRPRDEPVTIDRDAPDVVAFLDAERTWLAHEGLDATEHLVAVDDRSVRVLEIGDGPPVVIAPGGPGDVGYLVPLLAELDGYRILAVNLPGGGASDGIDARTVDDQRLAVATFDAVYDHFDLDAAPIIGNSRGGAWAWWYAFDRPDRVRASVKLGVPGYLEGTTVPPGLGVMGVPGLGRILLAVLAPSSPERAVDGFEAFMGHPRETVESLSRPAREFVYAAQQLPTYRLAWRSAMQRFTRAGGLRGWHPDVVIGLDDLAALDHPTLFVWPTNDPFGDVDTGRSIVARLPNAELEVAGIGHLPWLDDPTGVAELVSGFLDEIGVADTG